MLGNFSFGDDFKAEAIEFAWDLVTNDYGMPTDRLYVTVFREGDDAGHLWQRFLACPSCRTISVTTPAAPLVPKSENWNSRTARGELLKFELFLNSAIY